MKTDTWVASAIYGRVGAAIWTLIAVGFGLSAEDADMGNKAIIAILGGIGVLLTIVSKVREKMKASADAGTPKANSPPSTVIMLLIAPVILALMVSCPQFKNLPSVCDNLEQPSYLCDISKQYDTRLEDIGNALIIANAVAIGQKVYTREQAISVLTEIRSALDNPISYVVFKNLVYDKVDSYPGLLEVASAYFSILGTNTENILPTDRGFLKSWIDRQIGILTPIVPGLKGT